MRICPTKWVPVMVIWGPGVLIKPCIERANNPPKKQNVRLVSIQTNLKMVEKHTHPHQF